MGSVEFMPWINETVVKCALSNCLAYLQTLHVLLPLLPLLWVILLLVPAQDARGQRPEVAVRARERSLAGVDAHVFPEQR